MKRFVFGFLILVFLAGAVSAYHVGSCTVVKDPELSSAYINLPCSPNVARNCDVCWDYSNGVCVRDTCDSLLYDGPLTITTTAVNRNLVNLCDEINKWGDSCDDVWKASSNYKWGKINCKTDTTCPCVSDANDCNRGQTRCIGNYYWTCVKDSNDCWAWTTNPTPCALCSGSTCVCETGCAISTKECVSSTQNRTCVAGAGGCGVWSAATNCPTGKTCSNGICGCPGTPVCTAGQTKCSADGTGIQTCNLAGSCPAWGNAVACTSGRCDAAKCVLTCYPNCPTAYNWTNEVGQIITTAELGEVVNLTANTGIGSGVNVTFKIYEKDEFLGLGLGDDAIRGDTLLTANTSADGISRFELTINADDMESAKTCALDGGIAEFYFLTYYAGKKTGDNGMSGILNVEMDCGDDDDDEEECMGWYNDGENDMQVTYCSDYELISGEEEYKKNQCNQDCNDAKGNELANYVSNYPDEIASLYYCGWSEDDSKCHFYVENEDTGTKCEQKTTMEDCEAEYRTVNYEYTRISGDGSCPEKKSVSVPCAFSMQEVLPFFGWQNLLIAVLFIVGIYSFLGYIRSFKNIYKVLSS